MPRSGCPAQAVRGTERSRMSPAGAADGTTEQRELAWGDWSSSGNWWQGEPGAAGQCPPAQGPPPHSPVSTLQGDREWGYDHTGTHRQSETPNIGQCKECEDCWRLGAPWDLCGARCPLGKGGPGHSSMCLGLYALWGQEGLGRVGQGWCRRFPSRREPRMSSSSCLEFATMQ